MRDARASLGERAETLVESMMTDRGFVVLGRNVRVGRLEIDRILRLGSLVVFLEVRSRTSSAIVQPYETIDRRKIERVRMAASRWLATASLGPVRVRFDAASVVFDREPAKIDYFEDAF